MKRDEFGSYKGIIEHENCSSSVSDGVRPIAVWREGDESWPGLECSGCGKQWLVVDNDSLVDLIEWAKQEVTGDAMYVQGYSAARRHVAHQLGIQVADGELTKESVEAISGALKKAPGAPDTEGGPEPLL